MIEFYIPSTAGEWLPWLSSWVFVFVGLFYFLCPHRTLVIITGVDMPKGRLYAAMRANMGGLPLGLGISYLLFAQYWMAMSIMLAAACAAFGRLISFVFDSSFSRVACLAFLGEILLAIASFSYLGGYID